MTGENSVRICVFSLKGGQGKSSISAVIALSIEAGIVTNEPYSILEAIMPEKSLIKIGVDGKLPNIPKTIPIIYDFGGYVDNRVLEACSLSDHVIIPINPRSDGDIQAAIHTAKELVDFDKKIIFVCNMATKVESEKVKITMAHFFPNTPFFTINNTKAISNLRHTKKSVSELVQDNKLNAYLYRNINQKINDLLSHLKKNI